MSEPVDLDAVARTLDQPARDCDSRRCDEIEDHVEALVAEVRRLRERVAELEAEAAALRDGAARCCWDCPCLGGVDSVREDRMQMLASCEPEAHAALVRAMERR